MKLKGHVYNVRRLKSLSFFQIIPLNELELVTFLTKDINHLNLLHRLNSGSFVECLVEREKDTENYLLKRILNLKNNLTKINLKDFNRRKSNLKLPFRWLFFRTLEGRQFLDLRERVIDIFRQHLKALKFREIQTPIITAPTDEGARNFRVKGREGIDLSYALAQSPQIYKQFLIYGGVNYFQIAPSFRDEDSRFDRTNGEFYQVDVELAVDKLSDLERLSLDLVTRVLRDCGISYRLYRGISYHRAMEIYKTDKPRFLKEDVMDSFQGSTDFLDLIIVREFPVYERTKEGNLTYKSNPFLKTKKEDVGEQFDLVVSGVEILSGGLRSIQAKDFLHIYDSMGADFILTRWRYQKLLEGMSSGIPQHGGFGLGLERFLSLIAKVKFNWDWPVNEFIPFPLDERKRDRLTKAPF